MSSNQDVVDHLLFHDFIKACHAAASKQDFMLLIYPKLCKLFSHEMFVCGIGRISDLHVDHVINISFPENYIRKIITKDNYIRSPMVRKWVKERRPVYADAQDVKSMAVQECEREWPELFEYYGLRNIVGCGVLSACGNVAGYFSFANVPRWTEKDSYLLEIIVPHLQYALTNTYYLSSIRGIYRVEPKTLLSQREQEILKWICVGKSNGDIAHILSISPWTVKIHVGNILVKLNAANRGHAAAKAIQSGLVRV